MRNLNGFILILPAKKHRLAFDLLTTFTTLINSDTGLFVKSNEFETVFTRFHFGSSFIGLNRHCPAARASAILEKFAASDS